MIVNVRTFLRDFSAIKARARKGETVRVKDKDGEFLFTGGCPTQTIVGSRQREDLHSRRFDQADAVQRRLEAFSLMARLKYLLDTHVLLWAVRMKIALAPVRPV